MDTIEIGRGMRIRLCRHTNPSSNESRDQESEGVKNEGRSGTEKASIETANDGSESGHDTPSGGKKRVGIDEVFRADEFGQNGSLARLKNGRESELGKGNNINDPNALCRSGQEKERNDQKPNEIAQH